MAKFYYFAIFVLFAVLTKAEGELRNSIEIIEDAQKFLSKNSGVKLVPLQRAAQDVQTRLYKIGFHVNGDGLVYEKSENSNFTSPIWVQQLCSYPEGARVSAVEIWVNQTSNIGKAYISSGEIGERYISLLVEADHTTLFNYKVLIYGY